MRWEDEIAGDAKLLGESNWRSAARPSEEGYGSKRAVVPFTKMALFKFHQINDDKINSIHIDYPGT